MSNKSTFDEAVKTAIETYALSMGITFENVIELYEKYESTRESIQLLVLVQANPKKLRKFAPAA